MIRYWYTFISVYIYIVIVSSLTKLRCSCFLKGLVLDIHSGEKCSYLFFQRNFDDSKNVPFFHECLGTLMRHNVGMMISVISFSSFTWNISAMDFEVGKSIVKLLPVAQFGRFNGQTGPTKYRTWIVNDQSFWQLSRDKSHTRWWNLRGYWTWWWLTTSCWFDSAAGVAYSGNTSSNKPSQQDGAIIWPVGRHCRSPHQRRKKKDTAFFWWEEGFFMGCSGCIAVERFCDFLRCLSFLFRSDIVIQSSLVIERLSAYANHGHSLEWHVLECRGPGCITTWIGACMLNSLLMAGRLQAESFL